MALAVLYGGLGILSLVIGPVTWLAEGDRSPTRRRGRTGVGAVCGQPAVHLGAVMAALALMFDPAANTCLRAATPAPTEGGTRQDGNGSAAG